MIPIATFNNSARESVKLVRNTNLLGNYSNNIIYPDHMPGELRSLGYEKAWEKCTYNKWFNIQLDDGSLFIFKRDSYTYLMTPVKTLSYEEYMMTFYPEEEWQHAEEYRVMISQEYDNYVDTHTKNCPPMPIRYDIDCDHYCEHSHPYCHFHFGSENDGRIATKKILTPISFTAFVLRSFYPKAWKIYAESHFIQEHIDFFKQSLDAPSDEFWKVQESKFLYVG
ncbi:DUF2290 domain-containing protein [Buttiauxella sp. 3AFRM03]|uniref:DUF2290 domain-containing protein n=1 Tax=Buttiauxella sp. 3AFRM03 TaxID=2479367 RepID=UPI000EF77BE3|nr:DUF2290 domain-containing protein [Buttiauxella sp. 3AFRM03]AYN29240.1 DUF2290 domain-containing protein [Buttiauxella sp. 3AFRM03]